MASVSTSAPIHPAVAAAKRRLDLAVSVPALVVLVPCLPLIALAARCGRLRHAASRTGRLWPGLWSVLRGEMSLVGPRRLAPAAEARLADECPLWTRRLRGLRPGLISPAAPARADEPSFLAQLRERLLFDLHYAARLAGLSSGREAVCCDLAIVRGFLLAAAQGWRRSRSDTGNEVVRIDWPEHLAQVALDPRELAGRRVEGLGTELVPRGAAVTEWWYPLRSHALDLGECRFRSEHLLRELCDEARWLPGPAPELSLTRHYDAAPRAAAGAAAGSDRIRVELPVGLHDVHRLCERLEPLWQALTPRAHDSRFATSMSVLLLEGLAHVVGRSHGARRLRLEIRLAPRQVMLRLAALEAPAAPVAPSTTRGAPAASPAAATATAAAAAAAAQPALGDSRAGR